MEFLAETVIPALGRLRDHAMKSCIWFLVAVFSTGAVVSAQDAVQGWTGL